MAQEYNNINALKEASSLSNNNNNCIQIHIAVRVS